MNHQTKRALIDFISAVEELAVACTLDIGSETVTSIQSRCHEAKRCLEKDETIVEVR